MYSVSRTKDEPKTNQGTPKELPDSKKYFLTKPCPFNGLVLAAIPASSHPITLVHLVLPFPFLLAVLLCGVPEMLVAFLGALCGSAREILLAFLCSLSRIVFEYSFLPAAGYALAVPSASPSSPLHLTPYTLHLKSQNFNIFCDFSCPYQKNVVYLRSQFHAGGCLHVIGWGSRHI